MNKYLIYKYAMNLTIKDVKQYDPSLSENEINIINYYIKNKTKEFLEGNPTPILEELKQKLSPNTYNKILDLYNKYKSFLN